MCISIHGVVNNSESTIDPTTILLAEQNIEILVFVDLITFLIHSFARKFVFDPKTVIGLRA